MTIRNAITWAKKELRVRKIEGVDASVFFLMQQVLRAPKSFILANPEKKLTLFQERKFVRFVKRRRKQEPVWYITKRINFYNKEFLVNENVLIPRPETEILVEKILEMIKTSKRLETSILDIGTGSGAIVLSLASEIYNVHPWSLTSQFFHWIGVKQPNQSVVDYKLENKEPLDSVVPSQDIKKYRFYGSDISWSALKVAMKNKQRLELNRKVRFKKGDLFGPWVGKKFDVVVANLPYVPHEDMSTLAFDLTHYEPRVALDGGKRGLEIYKRFFSELPQFLNSGALVFCEIGDKQGPKIEKMVKNVLPDAKVEIIPDFAGFDRFVIIRT